MADTCPLSGHRSRKVDAKCRKNTTTTPPTTHGFTQQSHVLPVSGTREFPSKGAWFGCTEAERLQPQHVFVSIVTQCFDSAPYGDHCLFAAWSVLFSRVQTRAERTATTPILMTHPGGPATADKLFTSVVYFVISWVGAYTQGNEALFSPAEGRLVAAAASAAAGHLR